MAVLTRHFRHYLLGQVFLIWTDHASLVWLMQFKHPSGQLAHWLTELTQYAFQIEHRSGSKHLNADGMPRIPVESACDCYIAGQDVESLPCRGCEFCHCVNSQWIRFEEEVDDVVPITVWQRTRVRGQQDDLDLTHLWSNKKDGAVPRDCHSPGCMQSGALAQACVQPDSERLVRVIQAETTGDPEEDRGQISNYMEQYSFKELRDKQLRDPDLQPLFGWLEHKPNLVPQEGKLRMQSPATHNFWKHRTQLRWHQGVLQYQ